MITRQRLGAAVLGAALLLGFGVTASPAPSAHAAPAPTPIRDSLKNGSFEADVAWSSFAAGTDTSAEISEAQADHGRRSLRLVDDSTSSAVGWISDSVHVDPGKQYVATGRAYVDSGQAPLLHVKFYDAGGAEVGSAATSAENTRGEWQDFPAVSEVAPEDAASARVVAFSLSNRTGTSYVDAIELAPGDDESLIANQRPSLFADDDLPRGWEDFDAGPWTRAASTGFDASQAERYRLQVTAHRAVGTPPLHAQVRWYDEDNALIDKQQTAVDVRPGQTGEITTDALAPAETVRGEVVLGCLGTTRCDSVVDEVTVAPVWDRIFHAGPQALGTGDGSTPDDTADYRDEEFWASVDAALETGTAKVVLADGAYDVNSDDDQLKLRNLGSDEHRLLVTGESRYGVVFTQRADLSSYLVWVRNTVNLTVDQIHLTSDGNRVTPSAFLVQVDRPAGERTSGIEVRRISIADMPGVKYSGVGLASTTPSGPGVEDVVIDDGLFVRGGSGAGYHHVYATTGSSHAILRNSVLQDSAGTYVKLRDNTADWQITDNIFYSSGNWINIVQFIQWAVYNTTDPGKEFFSAGPYRITGNSFEARDGWCAPDCRVLNITARGYNPVDHDGVEWDHLLDPEKSAVLADESEANIETRRRVVNENFNLLLDDPDGIHLADNTYRNIDELILLWNKADYGAPTQGGDGIYNLSNLFATYRDGL